MLSRRKTTLVIIWRSHRKNTVTRWSGDTRDRATTRILVIAMNFTLLLRLVALLQPTPAAPLYLRESRATNRHPIRPYGHPGRGGINQAERSEDYCLPS